MIATAHVAAGALAGIVAGRIVSGRVIVRVILAATIGLASHMAMDALPHSEYRFMPLDRAVQVAMVEAVVACGIVWLVLRRRAGRDAVVPVVAGIGASAVPDLQFLTQVAAIPGAPTLTNVGEVLHYFHADKAAPPIAGLIGELALAATCLAIAFALARRAGRPATQGGNSAAVNNTP